MRPTSSKVRQAIFDILGQRCDDDHVLDLYAGSGSLGLEAARRGAARVVFVDDAELSCESLRTNLERRSPPCPTELLRADVVEGMRVLARRGELFDLVFADPPYDRDQVQRTLEALDELPLLAPGGVVVVEHSPRERGTDTVGRLGRSDERHYGQTHVSFFDMDPSRDRPDDTKGD